MIFNLGILAVLALPLSAHATAAVAGDCAPVAECTTPGLVYCHGRSKCIMDDANNRGIFPADTVKAGGWIIEYNASEGTIEDCEILIDVDGCDLTTGTKVGYATFDKDVFYYCLDLNDYEANRFQIYAGTCKMDEADLSAGYDCMCIETRAATLVGTTSTTVSTYLFDIEDVKKANAGGDYIIFPLGVDNRNYIVATLQVCNVGEKSSSPVPPLEEEGSTVSAPTMRPTMIPTMTPTMSPTMDPTMDPTGSPKIASDDDACTDNPSSSPTPLLEEAGIASDAPSEKPAFVATDIPTMLPTPLLPDDLCPGEPTPAPVVDCIDCPDFAGVGTATPTGSPVVSTVSPTSVPTSLPTLVPSDTPSMLPSDSHSSSPTIVPTVSPTFVPTDVPTTATPTYTPSGTPTYTPSGTPTVEPSDIPSLVPSTSPTSVPAVTISAEPTSTPSELPTTTQSLLPTMALTLGEEGDDQCQSAFVYCPGRSKCFTDVVNSSSDSSSLPMWGWSIAYNASEKIVLDCEIYIGGKSDCTMSEATKVGTFSMSPRFVHYCLKRGYVSKSFQFYSGRCPANDGGDQMQNTEECNNELMSDFADNYNSYPLTYEGSIYRDTFAFDETYDSTTLWNSYEVFPIGGADRAYMSAHVYVCPAGLATIPPAASPTPEEEEVGTCTTNSRCAALGLLGNCCPTSDGISLDCCGSAPTPKPTVPKPTPSNPTRVPTPLPKSSTIPSVMPSTLEPSNILFPDGEEEVTTSPTTPLKTPPCQETYAYCPNRSTSFADGIDKIDVSPSVNGNTCGWTIEFDVAEGFVDDCVLLTGLDDACSPESGTVIGSFFITSTYLHYCIFKNTTYMSNSFHSYIGTCQTNDNGENLLENGVCDPVTMASYATSYSTYPLVSEGGSYTRSFLFDNSDGRPSNGNPWGTTYQPFPMKGIKQISAHACIVDVL